MCYATSSETLAVPPIPYTNERPEKEVLIRAADGRIVDSPCITGKSRYRHAAQRYVGGGDLWEEHTLAASIGSL